MYNTVGRNTQLLEWPLSFPQVLQGRTLRYTIRTRYYTMADRAHISKGTVAHTL